ncbi:uncharacterized protein J4E84_001236 [Alternaria hordeiaustralica]|uniref:uncharacterized protein n=1 Tax=Alternaria hordeiaustralica TaxID=1187925 RepID=UPI0020C50692|nr:uncharacterized protein J4E84_001236 [Alternaria hordeiaustralica]KAI4698102.1 hypothetical protein J4E84_001236 [Alternaria hordeiaustralica]
MEARKQDVGMHTKPFKNSYLWRRHESGVHGFGSTRWICTLDSTVMTGAKCIFCSDIVYNMDHFDQHNVQICLAKDTAERVFDRKDLLKQHVQYVHLTSANDYTKKGFEPPDVWLETEDSFLPNPEGLWCGFCQLSFDTVARRMKHVAQHFQDGVDMVDWVRRLDFANSAMT